jgi:hypothetical protein
MGRMKDKYTDWDGDDEPNMLGKKGKKSSNPGKKTTLFVVRQNTRTLRRLEARGATTASPTTSQPEVG